MVATQQNENAPLTVVGLVPRSDGRNEKQLEEEAVGASSMAVGNVGSLLTLVETFLDGSRMEGSLFTTEGEWRSDLIRHVAHECKNFHVVCKLTMRTISLVPMFL